MKKKIFDQVNDNISKAISSLGVILNKNAQIVLVEVQKKQDSFCLKYIF